VSAITVSLTRPLPTRTTGESSCARPFRYCRCFAVSIAASSHKKIAPPERVRRGDARGAICANRLRQGQANHDAAVAQTAFRGVVVADRVLSSTAFDRDARRVDTVAAHEVIANGLGATTIEIRARTRRLTIVGVAN